VKRSWITGLIVVVILFSAAVRLGADQGDIRETLGGRMSMWLVIPFALILLGIAVIPLIHGRWWERHHNKAIVSALCALPALAYLVSLGPLGRAVLLGTLHDYYAFIVLLLALFTISGGISVDGDRRATPAFNTATLALGALLANLIGTTGASILLVRPLLATNSQRRRKTHVFVFFIFLVANIGGALLPVGDPPLFLGYVIGVPFFWTLGALWPAWLTEVAILLGIFYIWDTVACSRETVEDLERDARQIAPLRLHGAVNLILLGGVLLAAVFLRQYPHAGGTTTDLSWAQQPVMLLLALSSLALDHQRKVRSRRHGDPDPVSARDLNGFTFGPIIEVAVLFAGIFITMIPAICLLAAHGSNAGITRASEFYWIFGALSSFLDSAPAYASAVALGQSVTAGLLASNPGLATIMTRTGPIASHLLVAISLGCVFMGANTYIGNAPNLMIKAICEEAGVRMPGFFRYMLYALVVLIPTFLVIAVIFVA
jgi:Na+/H+ antiporter NhaD/arsenite permease-like protein